MATELVATESMATESELLSSMYPAAHTSSVHSNPVASSPVAGPVSTAVPNPATQSSGAAQNSDALSLEARSHRRLAILNSRGEAPQPSEIPTDEEQRDYCTADQLTVGSTAHVIAVSARCSELRHKLLSLGVVAGTKLEVTGVAPLGDPINVRLLGFTLSLRLCEAQCIRVERPL